MILLEERLVVFTGHFGSGKTELSINYALEALDSYEKVILVDLDIVNPFFRTAEVKEELEEAGLKIYMPNFATSSVNIPSLPADMYSVFADKTAKVIFDVGGDGDGARALGVFNPYFKKEDYRMFYVVNTKRPLTSRVDQIVEMKDSIEASSRLKVTDIINNTNLSYETQPCDIIKGQLLVDRVSQETRIPIPYISATKDIIDGLPEDLRPELFPLRLYMKPPWRQGDK
ncbi:MAG TPA: ATP-binding protein [Bacillota bacterium]|nr:ATP-binding protein [Bacillota bacterium]